MNHRVSALRWLVRTVFGSAVLPVWGEAGTLWIRPAEYPSLLLGPSRAEPTIAEEWRRLLRPGEVIFDVGANIGFTAQRFHALLGGDCRIWAFEPVARNVELLRRNVRKLGAVVVVPVAVGETNGSVLLRDNHHHGGLSRLQSLEIRPEHVAFWSDAQEVEVPMVSLDSYVAGHRDAKPTFIKLDVEGAGHWVLRGARRTIERDRPLVSCSFHSEEESAGILEVLGDNGYRGIRVARDGTCSWRPLDRASANFLHPSDPRTSSWRWSA
jgi:FkbM family methyltransferase